MSDRIEIVGSIPDGKIAWTPVILCQIEVKDGQVVLVPGGDLYDYKLEIIDGAAKLTSTPVAK